jgi:hypothetical protein
MVRSFRFILFVFIVICYSCDKQKNITIKVVDTNIKKEAYILDFNNAYQYGFVVPSKKQDSIDVFELTFEIPEQLRNKELYYKLYYQNESYKFKEAEENNYNPLAEENFYGSWMDTDISFVKIDSGKTQVSTSFIIHGNPRNEEKYINENTRKANLNEENVLKTIELIKSDNDWFEQIKRQAKKEKKVFETIIKDVAEHYLSTKMVNNRWQRNPRVGDYSLMLIVVSKEELSQIPDYIKNISKQKDGHFINPFYYFNNGEGKKIKNLAKYYNPNFLKIKASVPLKNGIYIPNFQHFESEEYFNQYVNNSEELYKNASFEYHDTYRADSIRNLPIKTNFETDNFSIADYKANQLKFDSTERISTWLACLKYPGKTFGYNEEEDVVWFKNPKSEEGEMKKEHVGFKTRHGMTYGKYTYKIKMTRLLNNQYVWNGITNAIWMLYDTGGPWNNRRICKGDGYYPYYITDDSKKQPQTSYSEIDFEILKAAEYWPKYEYKDYENERIEPDSHKDKVMITCTNWDLSCNTPKKFDVGVHQIQYQDLTFDLHRWLSYQNAVTSKVSALDEELFGGEYYYFQIEWKPKEIIWRVGPEKNQLRVVGYMNDEVTSIPNNQMITVFTQEYHYSHWWPNAPFLQEDVPFPLNDLNGKLYSIEIE